MIISARSSCASTSSGCAANNARIPLTKASSGSLASASRRAATAATYIFSSSVAFPGTWLNSTAFLAAARAREVAGATCLPKNAPSVSIWKRGRQSPAATIAMPHCGMGATGSKAAACRKLRSASRAQKECICARPWSKNCCASGLEVVIARCTVPMPDRSLAGSVGASELGGGVQLSALFGVWAAAANASANMRANFTADPPVVARLVARAFVA